MDQMEKLNSTAGDAASKANDEKYMNEKARADGLMKELEELKKSQDDSKSDFNMKLKVM